MSGRLALDFGTSNTMAAYWDDTRKEGVPLHIPDLGRYVQFGKEEISIIPSLIHYASDRRRWLGGQVLSRNLYDSFGTFRWMKRYIANRSPVKISLDGLEISHFTAGTDYLSGVLLMAIEELNIDDEEIAFTIPVESYEHYEDWLMGVAEQAGISRPRLIDEASAAVLGYGAQIQPGDVYIIFDFGGGTLDVSVVLIEIESDKPSYSGRRCRVLGKAGAEMGGASIDQWLFQEVLRQNNRNDLDDDMLQISRSLLVECEQAKERLSSHERADISVINPYNGYVLSAEFTRGQFEDLLDKHELFFKIDQTVRRALNAASERGYSEENIKSVLMVGGSSLIPSVGKTLQRIFGREKIMMDHPIDSVARGAAAFVAGVDFYDHIQHNYAIRHWNPLKSTYEFRTVVGCGTTYPSKDTVAKMVIKASHNYQTSLGIAIFEISEQWLKKTEGIIELIFDSSGAARLIPLTPDEEEERIFFWVNEHNPTFLFADPPASQNEQRFHIEFSLDANKRLLITARDLKTHKTLYRDYPVVKLR